MTTKTAKKARRKRPVVVERRRKPRLPEPEEAPEPVDAATVREAETLMESEDDFADGRSSAGVSMRAEEDAWGRGLAPEERPFEEEDVPPRAGPPAPRAEPSPDVEEPGEEEEAAP